MKDDAALAPKRTEVTPVKLVPRIVTEVPPAVVPEVGLSDVIVGAARYVKVELSVPLGVATLTVTWPADLAGVIAVIVVELTTVNDFAFVPPNVTAVVPSKLVPVIVTTVSPLVGPFVGVRDVIVGAE